VVDVGLLVLRRGRVVRGHLSHLDGFSYAKVWYVLMRAGPWREPTRNKSRGKIGRFQGQPDQPQGGVPIAVMLDLLVVADAGAGAANQSPGVSVSAVTRRTARSYHVGEDYATTSPSGPDDVVPTPGQVP